MKNDHKVTQSTNEEIMKTIFRLGLYFAAVAIMAAAPMLVAGIALIGLAIYHAMTWNK